MPCHSLDSHEQICQRESRPGHEPGKQGCTSTRLVHPLPLLEQFLGPFIVPTEQIVGQNVGADFLSGPRLDQ